MEDSEAIGKRQQIGSRQLAAGNFHEGWRNYSVSPTDRRMWQANFHEHRPPADLRGKTVAVAKCGGLGDELIFLRFVPQFRAKFGIGQVIYVTDDRSGEIFRRTGLFDEVVSPGDRPFECDYACLVDRLPLLLGMKEVSEIPPSLKLQPLGRVTSTIDQRLQTVGKGPFLGITWRAGRTSSHDGIRSLYKEIDLHALARAIQWKGDVLVLQRHARPEELLMLRELLGRDAHDCGDLLEDYESALALMTVVDEYVAVSNTNVHLRAAVGSTTRVLVPYPPEWRWMNAGGESPWFPGCTVYREHRTNGWDDVLTRVATDLGRSRKAKRS